MNLLPLAFALAALSISRVNILLLSAPHHATAWCEDLECTVNESDRRRAFFDSLSPRLAQFNEASMHGGGLRGFLARPLVVKQERFKDPRYGHGRSEVRLYVESQFELVGMVRRDEAGRLTGAVERLTDSCGHPSSGMPAGRIQWIAMQWAAPLRAWLECHVTCRLALRGATQRVAPGTAAERAAAERAFVSA